MVLQVDLEGFSDEIGFQRFLPICYVSVQNQYTCVQAFDPEKKIIIQAITTQKIEKVKDYLQEKNLMVREGIWENCGQEVINRHFNQNLYVAAISYLSSEAKPGLWVHTYQEEPTPAEVLKKIYDEFKEAGEIAQTHFEEFLRLACPNVLILSQKQLSHLYSL